MVLFICLFLYRLTIHRVYGISDPYTLPPSSPHSPLFILLITPAPNTCTDKGDPQ